MITKKSVDGIDGHAFPSMVVDALGDVHFTFTSIPQSSTAEVYYAVYQNGTTNTPQNVSNNDKGDYDPKILLDANGHPHIFWTYWGSTLAHSTNSSGSWTFDQITDMGWTRPAIGIDSQDIIHFAVTDGHVVKYGNNSSGSFAVTSTVATHAGNCYYPDMAIGANDMVHITYHSFADSSSSFPGGGEIFYANNAMWDEGIFPTNVSQLPDDSELYPGIAVYGDTTAVIGWARSGSADFVYSDIRMATNLPNQGGYLSGKANISDLYHYFGLIPPLDTAYWDFSIKNNGFNPLTVNSLSWQPNNVEFLIFDDFSGPVTLQNGDSLIVHLKAAVDIPVRDDSVAYSGVMLVDTDDPLDPTQIMTLEAHALLTDIENKPDVIISKNELIGNYPNPFNPTTTIKYNVANQAHVKLAIYNVRGQLMQTLVNAQQTTGKYKITWDGTNQSGIKQASGIYFCTIKIGDTYKSSLRIILLK